MQIIWLKRDLRLHDHEPLKLAFEHGQPVLPVYVHEPDFLARSDTSAQHVAFIRETLDELHQELQALGGALLEQVGSAVDVFEQLWQITRFDRLWAYQETTTLEAFARDKAVRAWCKQKKIAFVELPQNATNRGAAYREQGFKFREHLAAACQARLFRPGPGLPWASLPLNSCNPGEVPLATGQAKANRLKGGRLAAMQYLGDFVGEQRLERYPTAISSPLTAVEGCSRMSPYLAYGIVSDREVFQQLNKFVEEVCPGRSTDTASRLRSSVQFYAERLYWRSAYLQSLELRPESEMVGDVAALRDARETDFEPSWLEAWQCGKTGLPMVDAALRMLAQTGWLNMRMRGMVTSFAVNELWLPWRLVGLHLAREFLDYEPGIHWNQLQIHAGASRLSGPLTYNPVKQAQDHDPQGVFARTWVPELKDVPLEHIFEPWKMPANVQVKANCQLGRDYPVPLVPHLAANDAARNRVAALREGKPVPAQAYWKARAALQVAAVQSALF